MLQCFENVSRSSCPHRKMVNLSLKFCPHQSMMKLSLNFCPQQSMVKLSANSRLQWTLVNLSPISLSQQSMVNLSQNCCLQQSMVNMSLNSGFQQSIDHTGPLCKMFFTHSVETSNCRTVKDTGRNIYGKYFTRDYFSISRLVAREERLRKGSEIVSGSTVRFRTESMLPGSLQEKAKKKI